MALPFLSDHPDGVEIRLRIFDAKVDLTRWISYEFISDFLTPSDGWHFVVADEHLPQEQKDALKIGARIRLYVARSLVADGYIDDVEAEGSKNTGQQWTITGRDRLGHAVDAITDPTQSFKEGSTLEDMLTTLFKPFGWGAEDFEIDNAANRQLSTGGDRGIKTSQKGKALKKFVLHQLKPYNHEGVFAFASRVSQRFGLWIWLRSDGEKLIVGRPEYRQDATYFLRRTVDGNGNIESGMVRFSGANQPAIIVADGFSGGGEFGKGRIKAYAVNPYFGLDFETGEILPEVQKIIDRFPEAVGIPFKFEPFVSRAVNSPPRPMFLHDDESKTPEQLANFVRRELSLLTRKSLECHYVVEGHGQMIDGELVPWDIDTIVDVKDDIANLYERMYILGVAFTKSRTGGTNTRLHLVRIGSIQFGDEIVPKTLAGVGSSDKDPPEATARRRLVEIDQGGEFSEKSKKSKGT